MFAQYQFSLVTVTWCTGVGLSSNRQPNSLEESIMRQILS